MLFKSVFTVTAQFLLAVISIIHLISVFKRKHGAKKVNSTFIILAIIIAAISKSIPNTVIASFSSHCRIWSLHALCKG